MKTLNTIITIIVVLTINTLTVNAETNKIAVCHKGKTLLINENALEAHLKQGDIVGDCAVETPEIVRDSLLDTLEVSGKTLEDVGLTAQEASAMDVITLDVPRLYVGKYTSTYYNGAAVLDVIFRTEDPEVIKMIRENVSGNYEVAITVTLPDGRQFSVKTSTSTKSVLKTGVWEVMQSK